MIQAYGGPFWFAGILQLIITALTFASPLLLYEIIILVGNWALIEAEAIEGEKVLWHGYVMVFGLFIVTFLTAIVNGLYFQRTFTVGFRIRSALIR